MLTLSDDSVYILSRLKKVADGLGCCYCPLKRCAGRCALFKACDLIEEQNKQIFVKEAEIVRLRRQIEAGEVKST